MRNGILNFAPAPVGQNPFPAGCTGNGNAGSSNGKPYVQCQVSVDPKIKPLVALGGYWPEQNGSLSGLGNTGIYNLVGNIVFKEDYVTTRIDHKFSDKDSIFGTYLYDNGLTDQPSALNLWIFGNTSVANFAALEETHVFSPSPGELTQIWI